MSKKCDHGKVKQFCKDCSPGNFCSAHGKTVFKKSCLTCNPGKACIHKIPKARCKKCSGTRFRLIDERSTLKTFNKKLGKAIKAAKPKPIPETRPKDLGPIL